MMPPVLRSPYAKLLLVCGHGKNPAARRITLRRAAIWRLEPVKKATKQSRETARRKARQERAWAEFKRQFKSSAASPLSKELIADRPFGQLSMRSKQRIVEMFDVPR